MGTAGPRQKGGRVPPGQPRGEPTPIAAWPLALSPDAPDTRRRDWHAPFPLNLELTLSVHRRGPRDPTLRVDDRGAIWRTSLTPDGPGTLRLTVTKRAADPSAPPAGVLVSASAWGGGASWLLATLPDLLGGSDDPAAFQPSHPRLRDLLVQLSGLRISRTARVLEALVPAVLEQKVVGVEAHRAWRRLVAWYGSAAPGPAPAGMRVVPAAATWQAIPSWDWHRAGVEAVRARTIANAATVADRLEAICGLAAADAD